MEDNIFEKNSIFKTYMSLALPVVINMMISIVYNMADTYFIAKTNNLNLVAGVSLGAPIFMILMALGNIMGQGGSSLLSRLIGSNDSEGTRKVSSFCFYMAILVGVVISILMISFQKPFLYTLGADQDTYIYAWQYYIVLAFAAPVVVLTFIHSNLLRCEGLAFQSMMGSVSGTVLNIILDPIFISVFNWGAMGAALATVMGYIVSVSYLFYVTVKKSKYMSVSPKEIKIPLDQVSAIITVGIPAALTNIMTSVCTIMMNQFLLQYGNDKIAIMGIVMKVIMMGSMVLIGFSFGGAPLIGYFYGAKNKAKLNELVKFCYSFEIGLALIIGSILFVGSPFILSLFLKDQTLLAEAIKMFRLQIAGLPFMAFVLISTIFCQSFGKAKGSFILSISRQGVVFIAVILIMSRVFGYDGIIASQLVSDISSMIIALLVFNFIIRKSINEIK